MKTLIFAGLFLSINSFAATYIVEMQRTLSNQELTMARKSGMEIELFDQTQTDYFRRTYRIEGADTTTIAKTFPTKNIEGVFAAQYFSLEPKRGSEFIRPDRLFHFQWGLYNQGQTIKKLINNSKQITIEGTAGQDIRWKDAIKKIEVGLKREPLVAVVDTGVDYNHPELRGRIFKNLAECGPKGEILDDNIDRDGNGLKGDCSGWNFTSKDLSKARRPLDDSGHGTHVAGIIAAQADNEGVTGVSSKIRILPIKVTGQVDEGTDRKNLDPMSDRIARGILYATAMGADVINLSLGWTRSMNTSYLQNAVNEALRKGVIIVAAAGNNNNNATILPCADYDVICVGAATINGKMAEFSNYGGEVDVLAPGDEIMSTIPSEIIPLQLNLQGYDIRSGTSQAAPFVSATAALLRGNFSRINRDDIIRRIVDSADAGVPGKYNAGMLNLKGAFEIAPSPSVKPTFKNLPVILYDRPTGKFRFPLDFKNFGTEAKDVVVRVASKTEAFKHDQEYTIPLIRPGEVIAVNVEGEITDLEAHNQAQVSVVISVPGLESKTYVHEYRMAHNLDRVQDKEVVPFEFVKAPLPVGVISAGMARNNINSVETAIPTVGVPEFYLPRMVKESNSMEVRIFRGQEGKLKEVDGIITLTNAIQLLNVTRIDLNFDGVEDYWIRSIACTKDCDSDKAVKQIQYSAWSHDLTPLFGEKTFWKFLPTMFNVDLKSQRYIRLKTEVFGEILVPAFIETGFIPLGQQQVPTFSLPDTSVARRFYYLEPTLNKEGTVDLVTKTLSTTLFLDKVRADLKVSADEEIQALQFLNQSPADLKAGRVDALISVGSGYLRKNIKITLGGAETNPQPFSISQNLWGYEHLTSQNLETQAQENSFTGLVSKMRLVMYQTGSNKPYGYNASESVEVPLSTIASFKDSSNEYTFFQTPSFLMVASYSADGVELSKLKINRFSFLPGTLFNDSFYPVLNKKVDKYRPSLYVDETDIQNNIVSFTVLEEKALRTPLTLSGFVPPNCKAMNPVRLNSDEGHSFSLLCLDDKTKQWSIRFIKTNQ